MDSFYWFNNFTFIPGEPTLDPSMISIPQLWSNSSLANQVGVHAYSKRNPWFSPGSAPHYSPCGVAGGNPTGCPKGSKDQKIGDECGPQGGWAYGPKAEDYYIAPGFPDVVTTEWKAGDVVEVAWGMTANHAGGYAYRLCKVPEEGMGALTEECFQQGHLEFFGNMQAVQTGENVSSRVEFEAHRTKEGTFPKGSQWTRNPIPNCLFTDTPGRYGAYGLYDDPQCKIGTQFPAPGPGIFGYGGIEIPDPSLEFKSSEFNDFQPSFNFSIVDQLKVPSHLTPGDYVLSFRWDCEETSQIWATCSNIKIV